MHDGEVLLGAELAEVARGQDPQELDGVHGLHVLVLGEAVAAELVGAEEGGEGAVHVEGLVVEALEDLAADVGLEGVLGVVGAQEGGGGGVGWVGGGGGGGFDGADGGGDVPVGGAHEGEEEGCEGLGGFGYCSHGGLE